MFPRFFLSFFFAFNLFVSSLFQPSSAQAACETANLLIVLDNSGSMAGAKWTSAVAAINTITTTYQGRLRFGLEYFNSVAAISYGIDRCITDGNNCVSGLQTALAGLAAGGGTNLIAGIQTAQTHLTAVRNADPIKTRKMSVMFITDGQATCANAQVTTLFQQLGVQTFIIGFGTGVDAVCLNNMALAGQTAITGPNGRRYYQADNQSELNNAMTAIANAASTEICNNLDDDCDGKIDNLSGSTNPLTRACTGPCGQGTQSCVAGVWQTCTAARQPSPETCNNQDDDCDGQIDEGLTRSCATSCGQGIQTCAAGQWDTCTAPKPENEICDNKDNDCDGQIDEAITRPCQNNCGTGTETCSAGLWQNCDAKDTRPCGSTTGTCKQGTESCEQNKWLGVCSGEVKAEPETCDNKDNDCDGKIDNGVTRVCATSCGQGSQTCTAGQWSECDAPKAENEICDGKDNNCDGKIDNDLHRPCQSICGAGKETCQNGVWGTCDAIQPKGEVCDGKDNDCNGSIDEGDLCTNGKCVNGLCFRSCTAECPKGFRCVDNICREEPCNLVKCGRDEYCKDGKCYDACSSVTCKTDEVCVKGVCQATANKDCYTLGCPSGEKCDNGKCVADPCKAVTCQGSQFCRNGQCVDSCANVTCDAGAFCKDGKCEKDACFDVQCPAGEICKDGQCIKPQQHPCAGVQCPSGRYCENGQCVGDECANVVCPEGHKCHRGQCYGGTTPPPEPVEYPGEAVVPEGVTLPDGSTAEGSPDQDPEANKDNGQNPNQNKDAGIGNDDPLAEGNIPPGRGGCPCSVNEPLTHLPFGLLFALFLLPFLLRRPRSLSPVRVPKHPPAP